MKRRKFRTLLDSVAAWRAAARKINPRPVAVVMMMAATLGASAPSAQEGIAVLSPQALKEITLVEAEIYTRLFDTLP